MLKGLIDQCFFYDLQGERVVALGLKKPSPYVVDIDIYSSTFIYLGIIGDLIELGGDYSVRIDFIVLRRRATGLVGP